MVNQNLESITGGNTSSGWHQRISFLQYCQLLEDGKYADAAKELERILENAPHASLRKNANSENGSLLAYIACSVYNTYLEARRDSPEAKIDSLTVSPSDSKGWQASWMNMESSSSRCYGQIYIRPVKKED